MKKHIYAIIGVLIGLFPFLLSFDTKISFYSYWPSYLFSMITIGLLYITWDFFVTRRGDWIFNPTYTGTWRFLKLPLGEWLFFVSVPYACLFIYQVIRGYFDTYQLFLIPNWVTWIISGSFIVLSIINIKRGYSFLAFLSVSIFFALQGFLDPGLTGRSDFLIYIGLSFLCFLIVNGIYTSLPTISYAKKAFSGIKIFSIPLEDFFYNLSMLGFYALMFDLGGKIFPIIKQ